MSEAPRHRPVFSTASSNPPPTAARSCRNRIASRKFDLPEAFGPTRNVRPARSTSTRGEVPPVAKTEVRDPRHRRAPWAFLRGQGGHAGHSARVRRAGGVREPIRDRRPSTARRSYFSPAARLTRVSGRGRHMPEEVLRRDLQRPHATAGPEPGRCDPSRRGTRSAPAGDTRHARRGRLCLGARPACRSRGQRRSDLRWADRPDGTVEHDLELITRDRRAERTYRALGVHHQLLR